MTRRKQKPQTAAPKGPPLLEATDLSALERLRAAEPLVVDVEMLGHVVRFTGRRLRPSEIKPIQLLLERALPPLLAPTKPGEPERADLRDPTYLEEKATNVRKARALALFTAFPVFEQAYAAQGAAGPRDENAITKFMESRDIEEDCLDVLWGRLTERRVSEREYVGFTFGNSSPGV